MKTAQQNNTTQIVFNTSQSRKQKFKQKADNEGATQKLLFNQFMEAYINGKLKIQLTALDNEPEMEVLEVDTDTQKKMDTIAKLTYKK
jgi:hypothetical protein